MKRRLLIQLASALVLLLVSGLSLSQGRDDELTIRKNLKAEVAHTFDVGNIDELEHLSSMYREARSRTPSGIWKLTIFYNAIRDMVQEQVISQGPVSVNSLASTAEAWMKKYPKSPSAMVANGLIMQERAWMIRGHGYANTVSPEAWVAFGKAIEEVRKYFETIKGDASADPGWYCEMANIAKAQHWNRARFDNLLSELLDRHPYYYQALFCMVEYLGPSWYYENAGSIERFADQVVQKTEAEDGKSLYARIYWFMIDPPYADPSIVGENFAIWPKMKVGFEDLVSRYPDAWNLNNFAVYSCMAHDKKKTAELLTKIGNLPMISAWPEHLFGYCRKFALQP